LCYDLLRFFLCSYDLFFLYQDIKRLQFISNWKDTKFQLVPSWDFVFFAFSPFPISFARHEFSIPSTLFRVLDMLSRVVLFWPREVEIWTSGLSKTLLRGSRKCRISLGLGILSGFWFGGVLNVGDPVLWISLKGTVAILAQGTVLWLKRLACLFASSNLWRFESRDSTYSFFAA